MTAEKYKTPQYGCECSGWTSKAASPQYKLQASQLEPRDWVMWALRKWRKARKIIMLNKHMGRNSNRNLSEKRVRRPHDATVSLQLGRYIWVRNLAYYCMSHYTCFFLQCGESWHSRESADYGFWLTVDTITQQKIM